MSTPKHRLTDRQRAFCHHLITGITATEAARQAGYSHSYADREANRLVEKPQVAAYLEELRAEIKNDAIMTTEELQAWWSSITRGDPTPMTHSADGETMTINTVPDLKDRLKASELLGKSKGAFVDRVDHTTGGQPLKAYIGFNPEDV
ncbi:MAG TPA: terminase small subunit [Beutenbergiaceae bacterium]|nr:terminase small subunit [Beutenbergiaceae bacterium]